jgi:hypothetical protein
MPDWQQIGLHRCYGDGNLFVMELGGDVSLDEISRLLATQDALISRFPTVLTLCDARRAVLPSLEVRRFLAARGKRLGAYKLPSVVITNSVLLRTMVQLIEQAVRLLSGRSLDATFVTTEAAAWSFIAERRQTLPTGGVYPAS